MTQACTLHRSSPRRRPCRPALALMRTATITTMALAAMAALSSARRVGALVPAVHRASAGRQRCAALSAGGRAAAAVSQQKEKPGAAPAKLDLNPPRGTRDFYPEELRVRNWLFGQWRKTAAAHGFEARRPRILIVL